MAAALFAEVRKKCFRDADQPEDIGLEDRHVLGFGRFFNGSRKAKTGIVDDHIDATEVIDRCGYRGVHGGLIGHIERRASGQCQDTARSKVGEICSGLRAVATTL